jgi:hypothetical protein
MCVATSGCIGERPASLLSNETARQSRHPRLLRIYEFTRDAAEQAALPVPPSGDVYEICEAPMPDFEVVN